MEAPADSGQFNLLDNVTPQKVNVIHEFIFHDICKYLLHL